MSANGSMHVGAALAGDYELLWISTPADWHMHALGKRTGAHWNRMRNLEIQARGKDANRNDESSRLVAEISAH
eukprot:6026089-Pyramimonas_sp.AAC.1